MATNKKLLMHTQSLLRTLAGSVETALAEREISCMNPSPSVVSVENSHLSGPDQYTHSSHILLMFTASVLDLTSLALMIHPTHSCWLKSC